MLRSSTDIPCATGGLAWTSSNSAVLLSNGHSHKPFWQRQFCWHPITGFEGYLEVTERQRFIQGILFYHFAPRPSWTQRFSSARGPSRWVFCCWQGLVLNVLVKSVGTRPTALNLQQSVVFLFLTAIAYYVKNILFLCFKPANVLLENAGRDTQRMRLTLFWNSWWGCVCKDSPLGFNLSPSSLSLFCTQTYVTLSLTLRPALPHCVPTSNQAPICSALSHHMKLSRHLPNCCESTSSHSAYTTFLKG